jgi:hypothetical protein
VRKPGPRAAVIGVLAALVAFFYRGLFQGLVIGDYDAFVYFYPLREYAARVLREGHFPLWNPYLFMGSPFFANVQTAVLYPLNLLFLILPTPYAFSASVVVHVMLAAVGMYLFGRRVLVVSALPALLGAVAFTFGGFISWQVGHINQLSVSAWLPLLLVVFDEAVRRRSLALAIGTGLIGTLQLLAGHTQEWYFSTATLGLFALWHAAIARKGLPEGKPRMIFSTVTSVLPAKRIALLLGDPRTGKMLRPVAYLLLAGLVEAAVSAVQWMPTMELSGQSIRSGGMSYGEAISFSLPPTTALYTLLPAYPSELFSEYVGYVGMIPLVLAAFAIAGWRARGVTLFMAGLGVLGLFMAIGGYNPLAPLLFKLIPGLDLFRVPARWLLVYTFGAAGLSALGAQLLVDISQRRARRLGARAESPSSRLMRFTVSAVGIGGAVLVVGILVIVARPVPTVHQAALWAGLMVAAVAVSGLSLMGRKAAWVAISLLIAGTSVELWVASENAVFQHPIPPAAFAPQRTSTSFLLDSLAKSGAPERVLSVATDNYEVKETPDYKKQYDWLDPTALRQFLVDVKLSETLASNVAMEYGIQSADGYDGGILPLKRYAELKSLVIPDENAAPDSQLRINLPYVPPENLLDLLNARYVLGGKIKDATVENVYYDRGVSVALRDGETRTLTHMPDLQATSVGIISSTSGARSLGDGVTAGTLVVTDVSGTKYELPLRLGMETAETALDDGKLGAPAHKRPLEVANWPQGTKDTDYFVKIKLPARVRVKEISMNGQLQEADLRVRAITLIDDVAAASSPLVLSDNLGRALFWDMKLYDYTSALPRAYVTYSSVVRADEPALGVLAQPTTRLNEMAILAPSSTARNIYRSPDPGFRADDARISSYQPEQVVVDATAREDGYLVLMDTFYPGWTAEVDGKPAPIERADYLFRSVFLPQGQHRVVFKYAPSSFQTGVLVSGASVAVLACVMLGLAVRNYRRRSVL